MGCSLDVTATWRHLADRARAAGATIETGTLVRHRARPARACDDGGRPARVRCRLAIDATGTPSLLARSAGVHQGFRRVGVGYERELRRPASPSTRP